MKNFKFKFKFTKRNYSTLSVGAGACSKFPRSICPQVEAPILARAALVKKELEQTKALRSKLDTKDGDIRELKILVKIKQEEIGELTIRKDIAEKKVANSDTKLANTIRDYEQTVQKLQVRARS